MSTVSREEGSTCFLLLKRLDQTLLFGLSFVDSQWIGFTMPSYGPLAASFSNLVVALVEMFLSDFKAHAFNLLWEWSTPLFTNRQPTLRLLKMLPWGLGIWMQRYLLTMPCKQVFSTLGVSLEPHPRDLASGGYRAVAEWVCWWMNAINQGSFNILKGQEEKG